MSHSIGAFLAGLVLLAAPMSARAQPDLMPPTSIDDLVEWLEPLVLAETAETPFVDPRLIMDPAGGFLVVDRPVAQVRVYRPDGSLVLWFGREGDGPGEFRDLRGVIRLPEGQFSTVDFTGRVALWNRDGQLLRDHRPPIAGLMGLSLVGGSRVAIVSAPIYERPESGHIPWVRFFDLDRSEAGAEVLSLPGESLQLAASMQGQLNPTLGRRFALTWSMLDSLWIVDLDHPTRRRAIQIDSGLLRANSPAVDRVADREGFIDWMVTSTFVSAAFPAPDGGWLITLWRPRRGGESEWGLLHMDDTGRTSWELHSTPRLVATDPEEGVLYFAEPTGLAPNRFNRARLAN